MSLELLLIEDDPDILETISEVLCDDGFAVRGFPDAVQALAWLELGPRPAAILLDYHLPGVDGLEFCRRKQALPLLAEVPVVLITADVRMTRARPAEVTATIAKPFDVATLLKTVREVLAAAALSRAHEA